MTKTFCNHCGKELGRKDPKHVVEVREQYFGIIHIKPVREKTIELCPECFDEFKEFLEGEK